MTERLTFQSLAGFCVPPGLTFKDSTLCCHIAFMCFVRISEETATSVLYSIKGFVLNNRSGECLLSGTESVLTESGQISYLKV